MNPVMNMLMQKLQKTNPGGYNMINQLRQSGGNPNAILNQMMGNMQPQQKQQLLQSAKRYGVPDNVLSHFQNMK
jgi:hypothetical protein